MKKLLLIFAAIAMIGIAKADDQPIDFKDIPRAAKEFITKHFKNIKVVRTIVDKEVLSTEYTVYLEDGSEIDFNGNGLWIDVDCKTTALPNSLIPEAINTYIKTNYVGKKAVKIDNSSRGYEVKLSNGIELKFNKAMQFVGIDD